MNANTKIKCVSMLFIDCCRVVENFKNQTNCSLSDYAKTNIMANEKLTLEKKYNGLKLLFKQLLFDEKLEEEDVFKTVGELAESNDLDFLHDLNTEIMDEYHLELMNTDNP